MAASAGKRKLTASSVELMKLTIMNNMIRVGRGSRATTRKALAMLGVNGSLEATSSSTQMRRSVVKDGVNKEPKTHEGEESSEGVHG